ncbi:TPA: S8 family serine peptidase [Candidatus Woesearchaeota archaeon]|nr:S8 family serine peptidase [Candidatus Woesearchaeota archaeon]
MRDRINKNAKIGLLFFVILIVIALVILPTIILSSNHDANNLADNKKNQINLLNAKIEKIGNEKLGEIKKSEFSVASQDDNNNNKNKKLYILQFADSIRDEWKQELEQKFSLNFNKYIPNNAFLLKIRQNDLDAIAEYDFVNQIVEYKAEYKLSPEIDSNAGTNNNNDANSPSSFSVESSSSSPVKNQYRVIVADGSDVDDVKLQLEQAGINSIIASNDMILIDADSSELNSITNLPEVEWIEPQPIYKILNDNASVIIEAPTIWNTYNLNGSGQIIAVADSGIDTGVDSNTTIGDIHLDFDNRIGTIYNLYGSGANDTNGHGTHVSGSIVANGNRSNGQFKGMAFGATLIFQAIGDDEGSSTVYPPNDLHNLYAQAYNTSARLHSNSWGGSGQTYGDDPRNTDDFVWNYSNMVILFAAGNSGAGSTDGTGGTLNTVGTPAIAKNVIAVGSTENIRASKGAGSDNINHVSSSSSRGPANDQRIKPDIVAPGNQIVSTQSSLSGLSACSSDFESNGNYSYCSGTSMATPIAAGSATLVRQYFVQNRSVSDPTAALIKAALINGAVDIGYGIPSNHSGWGRINLSNTMFPASPRKIRFSDNATRFSTGGNWTATYKSNNTNVQLKFTLVWTDYPAALSASTQLVNDLNLLVTIPNGSIYFGNNFVTPYNSSLDTVNNVEQITINSPPVGDYFVNVSAKNIALGSGKQTFALVVSGAIDDVTPIISYAASSPPDNNETLINSTLINITSDEELSVALLEWNGTTNYTMTNGSGARTHFYYNVTNLEDGNYTYKVFGNDTVNNFGVSATRTIQIHTKPVLTYVSSTVDNNSKFPQNFTLINISASEALSVALLEFNFTTNYTMINGSGTRTHFYYNLTGLNSSSLWRVRIFANDTDNNWGVSELRFFEANNTAPVITTVSPNSTNYSMNEGESVTFSVNYTDLFNPTFNITWLRNWTNVSSHVGITTTHNFTFSPNHTQPGFWNISILVNDGYAIGIRTWNLTVNTAPDLTLIANITVNETQLVNVSTIVNASDANGDAITYYYTSPINATGFYLTNYQSSGIFNGTVTASDGIFNTSKNFTLTINEIEDDDNDGTNNSADPLIGNISSVTATTVSVNITVNSTTNLTQTFNGSLPVKILNGSKLMFEFNFNFSKGRLNLSNMVIVTRSAGNFSGVLIRGLNLTLQNQTKTVYLDNVSSQNSVCINDAEITALANISAACSGVNETLVTCDGIVTRGYNCTAIDSGTRFLVSGLNHSGVNQQCGDGDGDGFGTNCLAGPDCDDTDSSKTTTCTTPSPSSGGGGGGGGGATPPTSYTVSILAVPQAVDLKKTDSIIVTKNNIDYSIQVALLSTSSVDFTITYGTRSSSLTLFDKETKKIDLDGDGVLDIQLTPEIITGKVKLTYKNAIDPTCFDGIRNQGEDQTDCGGPCISCEEILKKVREAEAREAEEKAKQTKNNTQAAQSTPAVTANEDIQIKNISDSISSENAKIREEKATESVLSKLTRKILPKDEKYSGNKRINTLIFVAIIVLMLPVSIYFFFMVKSKFEDEIKNELEKFRVHKVHEDLEQVERYIEHAIEKGRAEELIRSQLQKIGWSDELVENSLAKVEILGQLKANDEKDPRKKFEELEKFVEQLFVQDKSEDEIRKHLEENGWSREIVNIVIKKYDILQSIKAHKIDTHDEDAKHIHAYIEYAISTGKNESEIKKALKEAGWPQHLVHDVFKEKQIQKELEEHNVHQVHDDVSHLEDYVSHVLDKGRSHAEIKKILTKVGWDKQLVHDTIQKKKKL